MIWVLSLSPTDLSTHGLTPGNISQHSEFVWVW